MTDTLRALEKRLAEASGPDADIDYALWTALGGPTRGSPGYPNGPTASLDAAVALVERVLPGGYWEVRCNPMASVRVTGTSDPLFTAHAKSPALALLLACVRALIAEGER